MGRPAPKTLSRQLMIRILLWREQINRSGDIDASTRAMLADALKADDGCSAKAAAAANPRPGSVLVREHDGVLHRVMVLDKGYAWNGRQFASLSAVARAITGTNWNGRRFFGLDRKTKANANGGSDAPLDACASRHGAAKRNAECEQAAEPIPRSQPSERIEGSPQ